MELTTEIKTVYGKNEMLDILMEELNVKEVVSRDKDGFITRTYDGVKTIFYKK